MAPFLDPTNRGGVNYRAMIAMGVGVPVALVGLVVPWLRWLYDYAWFVGFFAAGGAYCVLMANANVQSKQSAEI